MFVSVKIAQEWAMIATENLTMTKNQTIKVGDYVLVALPHESQFLEIKVENLRPFDR